MASPELTQFLANFKESMMDGNDPLETVVAKMNAIHPHGFKDSSHVEHLDIGGVPCAWVSTPKTDETRTVFFAHGGAFVSTGLDEYYSYAESVADHCNAKVLIYAYTLAPEMQFPGQIDQSLAVWEGSGMDPERTAFMGDSCGGGIALATMLRLRDAGKPLPVCYAGLTPWFDALQQGDAAVNPRGVDPFVNGPWIRERFKNYAGSHDLNDPLLSPINADLTGLPPLYLGVGSIDTVCDDSTRLATRAGVAGVTVSLDLSGGLVHGLHGLAGMCPEATAAMVRVGEFVHGYIPTLTDEERELWRS